ncbi:MAG TPA: thymidine phosphorylase [Planctomycetes bacterium]|nr:thymidine phosphorylase [Planctomycetota bacterium]
MKNFPARLIAKKRDHQALAAEEIQDLVDGVVDGSLSDAQLGALLMAGFLVGNEDRETVEWTRAMRDSGQVLDLSDIPGVKVDKHSTGGVGDKVSLVLAPLVACLGVPVPMVSGRGLGHTGGTVDKLLSIPGFRMDLGPEEFEALVRENGLAMSAATDAIAPADRRMYATRDVTATVESISWITSSILSKKLAEGIDALVLDVKCGRGAFMKNLERAQELAESLVRTANLLGCRTSARVTNMDRPLGKAIGNSLEVEESIHCLRGGGPQDLREVVLLLAADMLVVGEAAAPEQAMGLAAAALDDGRALERFRLMVEAQGGDPRVVDSPKEVLGVAPVQRHLCAEEDGFLEDLDPFEMGWTALELGAGRRTAKDPIDPQVGLLCRKAPGDPVARGEVLVEVHARREEDADRALDRLRPLFKIGAEPPMLSPLLLATVAAPD